MCFAIFPVHVSEVLRLPRKKVMLGHTKCAPVTQNHLPKTEDLMLQNATFLRKSAPWPPNISDEDVSCTAPATENTSFQILFKCPTLASVFGNSRKLSRFAHFKQGAQSLAPATRNDIWTSKSALNVVCFVHFDFEMCFAPKRRALFRHLNFQKWSEHGVLCTFWLWNVLRATTACTFSTSQLPKVVRSWGVLYILTSKCGFYHNRVQFVISHLARLLRTHRFSEPTFRPSRATNQWKNAVFRDFPTFLRTWIFFLLALSSDSFFWLFLLTLCLLWSSLFFSPLLFSSLLLSSLLFSSLLLSSLVFSSLLWLFPPLLSHLSIVGSLTSKLPSIISR